MNASRLTPALGRVLFVQTRRLLPVRRPPFLGGKRSLASNSEAQSAERPPQRSIYSGSSASASNFAFGKGSHLHAESEDPTLTQPKRRLDLKVGPYTRGRFFVSPREDPKEFVLCVIVLAIFAYTLVITYTQPGGETVNQRRRRIIRERLMREAGITQADLDALDGEEAPLSA